MSVMQLGLGLGLAGAAGIRAYFPLLLMALLTRFGGTVAFRPPFKAVASIPVLLIFALLAAFEIMAERSSGVNRNNQAVILAGLRMLSGAILFAGTFGSFGFFLGMLFGALLSGVSYLITVRLRPHHGENVKEGSPAGAEETAAVASTVMIVLMPWVSYFIWGAVLFVLVRKIKANNNRYRPEGKAGSWR